MSVLHNRPEGQPNRVLKVMRPPSVMRCLEMEWDLNCPWSECAEHVPGIPGDALRSKPVCGRALVDVTTLYGGVSQRTCAWLLGWPRTAVQNEERAGREKLAPMMGEWRAA